MAAIYALRDVTGTVANGSLIASSIMSKKLAAGASGIVLDVKLGRGAFMKTLEEARALATTMVQIGVDAGRDMVALLSDVNQPLGVAVGNALEVAEAVRHAARRGAGRFSSALRRSRRAHAASGGAGRALDESGGSAGGSRSRLECWRRLRPAFVAWWRRKGGDVSQIEDPRKLPQAKLRYSLHARESGFLGAIDADQIAWATLTLGAGRRAKDDEIDHAVGIEAHRNVGDAVTAGDLLMTIHANAEVELAGGSGGIG